MSTFKNPKGITKRYKGCINCGANTVHKEAKICPFCGKEPEDDELEDGLELEEVND